MKMRKTSIISLTQEIEKDDKLKIQSKHKKQLEQRSMKLEIEYVRKINEIKASSLKRSKEEGHKYSCLKITKLS